MGVGSHHLQLLYQISEYDHDKDKYSRLYKTNQPNNPYNGFNEAATELVRKCGYGKIEIKGDEIEMPLMRVVTL